MINQPLPLHLYASSLAAQQAFVDSLVGIHESLPGAWEVDRVTNLGFQMVGRELTFVRDRVLGLANESIGFPIKFELQLNSKYFCSISVSYGYLRYTYPKGNPLQYSCLENPMDSGTW